MPQKKPSEWLSDFDGHDILGAAVLDDLKKEVGDDFGIKPISMAEMKKLLEAEGRGGSLYGEGDVIPALWIAETIGRRYDVYNTKFGRGSGYREIIRGLREKGQ